MILIEPPTENRRTGGYRINAAICHEVPEIARLRLAPGALTPRALTPRRVSRAGPATRDIVFVDSLYLRHSVAMGALRRLRRRGARLVLLAHLLPSQEQPGRFRRHAEEREGEDRALSAFDGALVPSRFMARELWRRGFAPARLALLRLAEAVARPVRATDPAGVSRPGDPDSPLLLSIANLSPVKHLHSILPALAELQDVPWRWEIIGSRRSDPGYVRRFRRLAGMYGLGRRVRLRGPRRPEELASRIAGARAVLVPSRFESFGLVARQSLLAGTAVLASRVGGLPEALALEEEGRPGGSRATRSRRPAPRRPPLWLPAPGDRAAWTAALRELLCTEAPGGNASPELAGAPPLRAESPAAAVRRIIAALREEEP